MTYFCVCCGKPWRKDNEFDDEHHCWPKSQNGPDTDDNKVKACRDDHSLYTAICGTGLAKTVKGRVKNYLTWMAKFPTPGLMGQTPQPGLMAPEFVRDEVGEFMDSGALIDLSEGRLSKIDKVAVFKERPQLGKR